MVFPEPVGPVSKTSPLGRVINLTNCCNTSSVQAEGGQVKTAIAWVENSHHDLFPARRRKNRNALFDPAQLGVRRGVAFLGQAGLVGDEVGHDLEAAGNLGHQIERQMNQLRQDAIETDAHGQGAFPRLDMNITGASLDGVEQQVFDQRNEIDAGLGRFRL